VCGADCRPLWGEVKGVGIFPAVQAQTSLDVLQENSLGFGGLYFLYLLRKPALTRSGPLEMESPTD